jgi:hypothetical protein
MRPESVSVAFMPRNDVHMRVKDDLSCWCAVVGVDIDATRIRDFSDGRSNFSHRFHYMRKVILGDRKYILAMSFWDHQGVSLVQGFDIEKSECLFVFINFFTGNGPSDDLTKEAIFHT